MKIAMEVVSLMELKTSTIMDVSMMEKETLMTRLMMTRTLG
jgi:hypothetical protein